MSAYSTLYITRTKARAVVLEKVWNISDRELEDILDKLLESRLYNAVIVNDDCKENDDELI